MCTLSRFAGFLFWVFFAFYFLTVSGCGVNEPIVEELDRAYAIRQSNDDVTASVQKYFPLGADIPAVTKSLYRLSDAGFSISEYRFEGARSWPSGELKPYQDEQTKKNMENRYPRGTVEYVAELLYDRKYLLMTKTVVISVRTDGSSTISSIGRINVSGI